MLKHVYATSLLLAISCATFAQNGFQSDYRELPDPRPIDPVAWNTVKPGTHTYFGSADIRYEKNYAPNASSLRSSWSAKAWKGEKVHTQLVIYTTKPLTDVSIEKSDLKDNSGNKIPASAITSGFVRYVMTDELNSEGGGCGYRSPGQFDSSLVADGIDYMPAINVAANTTQPVWLSVKIPPQTPAGVYKGSLKIKVGNNVYPSTLNYEVVVSNRTLPQPKDWAFHLDLWQSPYAVARIHNTKLWSKEHFAAMKPYMEMLANAGQKSDHRQYYI